MGCAKSKSKDVPAPWPLESHSRQEWIAWRSYFLTYVNENYIPPYKQGNHFFEYIGSIGLEIAETFYFRDSSSKTNIDVLLFKFDVYYIFGGRKRHENESIDEYIKALKTVAEKTGKINTDKIIREKLVHDLHCEKIFEQFLEIMPSFTKITDYESLALHELIFMWEECRKSLFIKQNFTMLEARKRDAFENIRMKDRCLQCDRNHKGMRCAAIGQKCGKCGNFNHFARCCLKTYIKDCLNCGSNHIQGKCPAFAKECSRCKKMSHFPWQCFAEVITNCDFCGQGHINNRQKCPALNSTCTNCQKLGHYSFKCHSRKYCRNRK